VKLFITSSAVYFFSFVTADPDLWGHVKFGEATWQTKTLSPHNLYSFTAPDHPWINHEWLSELIFYAIYSYLGDAGLLLLKLSVGLVIVWLISTIGLFRAVDMILFAIGFGLVISVISPGFMVRPQLFSFLGFTCFFYIFHCYFERKKNRLWLLPLIMVIWCNSHGGFLIGWGQYTIILVWQSLVYVLKDRKAGPSLRGLFFWYLLTTLACFITPYGPQLLVFLYHSLSKPRPIGEWNPIRIWDTSFMRLKILAALFVASLVYPSGRKRQWEVVLIAATLILALRHQRNTPFFAIVVGASLVEWSTLLSDRLRVGKSKITLSHGTYSVLCAFLLLLVTYHMSHATYRYLKAGFHVIVDPSYYPVQAIQFIKVNRIKGNLVVPFEWGEYAIWKLYPDCQVSVDGRFRTAYPENVLRDHIFPVSDDVAWSRLIKKYPSDVILSSQIPFFWNLIKTSREWIYVYSDRVAMVFVRNNEKNRDILDNLNAGKLTYPHGPVSIYFP
jgi:hypothetical protein